MKGFRQFILRGSVVDLAVGIVIGVAFGTVISSFVKNLLTPLISIPGTTNFSDLTFKIRHSTFRYGAFFNDLISFVIIAAAVYFLVILPLSKYMERRASTEAATTKKCFDCLTEIPIEAHRCAACGTEQVLTIPQQTQATEPTRNPATR